MTMRDFCARNEQVDPPDVPLCSWCDGAETVEVVSVRAANGAVWVLPMQTGIDVPCPHCWRDPGVEPQPDPADDPLEVTP